MVVATARLQSGGRAAPSEETRRHTLSQALPEKKRRERERGEGGGINKQENDSKSKIARFKQGGKKIIRQMSTEMRFVTGWSPSVLSLLSSSSFPSLWRFSCRPNPLLAQTFTRSLSRLQLISALCCVLSASPPHPHLLAPLPSPPLIWRSLQHYVTSLRYYSQRRASLNMSLFSI